MAREIVPLGVGGKNHQRGEIVYRKNEKAKGSTTEGENTPREILWKLGGGIAIRVQWSRRRGNKKPSLGIVSIENLHGSFGGDAPQTRRSG